MAFKNTSGYYFMGYDGKDITSPVIEGANDVISIWQDVENLVTDIKLDSDKKYVEFTVNKETIAQGNALLAVRDDSGNVIWSWHIWVTDFNPYDPQTGYKQLPVSSYKMMSQAVGWCSIPSYVDYVPRQVLLRVTQKDTGISTFVTIGQTTNMLGVGNSTLYQWGRKDPFVGGRCDGGGYTNKMQYNVAKNYEFGKATYSNIDELKQDIIKHPNIFVYNNYFYIGGVETAPESWSTDYKTIHDPSPRGFRLAPQAAFGSSKYVDLANGYIDYYGCDLPLNGGADNFYFPNNLYLQSYSSANPSYNRTASSSSFWDPEASDRSQFNNSITGTKILLGSGTASNSNLVKTSYERGYVAMGVMSVVDE